MKVSTNIQDQLQEIKVQEGPDFSCDEELLTQFIQTQQEPEPAISTRVLSFVGGTLATLTFIGFLLVAGLYNSTFGLIIFGLGSLTGGIILHNYSKSLIYDSTAISLFLIGFVLFLFGLSSADAEDETLALASILIGLTTYFISQSSLISFVAILMASGGFLYLINEINAPNLLHLYNFVLVGLFCLTALNEAYFFTKTYKTANKYQTLFAALIVSLIVGLFPITRNLHFGLNFQYFFLSSVAPSLAIVYFSYVGLNQLNSKGKALHWVILGLLSILLFLCAFTPGISGTLLIIILSYKIKFRPGLAIGIVTFVYFISGFYYNLELSLLNKSLLLIGTGITFLALYNLILKLQTNEQD
jgi:uncharacterized membrane protein